MDSSRKRALPRCKAKAFVVQLAVCFVGGALAPMAATGGGLSVDGIRASFLLCRHAQRVASPPPAAPDIGLLLIVTVTRLQDDDASQAAALTRLGHTLRHVAPPLIWIVVGAENRTAAAAVQVLRGTGVMFRHLTYAAAENATTGPDADAEGDRRRNVALSHIERHRLAGVVHFAGASGVYDLRFFQELRQTRGFAAWPTATVSTTDQGRITVQGPKCSSSKISGWYSKHPDTNTTDIPPPVAAEHTVAIHKNSSSSPEINISGLGFRSSILWDSEMFISRNNSLGGENQDFIHLVRQVAAGDGGERKGIPTDCSEYPIRLWHLGIPSYTPENEEHETRRQQSLLKKDEDDYKT